MTDPKHPLSPHAQSMQPGPSVEPSAEGWVKQVQPESPPPALAYPPPPGSTQKAPPASAAPTGSTGSLVPTPQAHARNPHAQPVPTQGAAPPQVVHNTVVQNHYHSGGAQLVRTASRDRTLAAALAFFLGAFGVHRYYLGRPGSATVMLVLALTGVFLPVVAIWAMVDMISILTTSRERFDLRYNCSIAPGALPPPGVG